MTKGRPAKFDSENLDFIESHERKPTVGVLAKVFSVAGNREHEPQLSWLKRRTGRGLHGSHNCKVHK